MVGVLSVLVSMVVLLPSLYMLVRQEAWQRVREVCHEWLEQNHWDIQVGNRQDFSGLNTSPLHTSGHQGGLEGV